MNDLWIHAFANLLEIALLLVYFRVVLGEPKKGLLVFAAVWCLYVFYTAINVLTDQAVYYVISYCLVVFALSILFIGTTTKRFTYASMYIVLTVGLEYFFWIFINNFYAQLQNNFEIMVLFSSLLRFLAVLILSRVLQREKMLLESKPALLIIGLSILLVSMMAWSASALQRDLGEKSFFLISWIVFITAIGLGYYQFIQTFKNKQTKIALLELQSRIEAEADFSERIIQQTELLKKLRHDYHNRITGILLAPEADRSQQLHQLLQELERSKEGLFTEQPVINYL